MSRRILIPLLLCLLVIMPVPGENNGTGISDAALLELQGDELFAYALDEGMITADIEDLVRARSGSGNTAGDERVISQGFAIREALRKYGEAVYADPPRIIGITRKLIIRLDQIISYLNSADIDPILNTTWSAYRDDPGNETAG